MDPAATWGSPGREDEPADSAPEDDLPRSAGREALGAMELEPGLEGPGIAGWARRALCCGAAVDGPPGVPNGWFVPKRVWGPAPTLDMTASH
jgi:hypothetical protein